IALEERPGVLDDEDHVARGEPDRALARELEGDAAFDPRPGKEHGSIARIDELQILVLLGIDFGASERGGRPIHDLGDAQGRWISAIEEALLERAPLVSVARPRFHVDAFRERDRPRVGRGARIHRVAAVERVANGALDRTVVESSEREPRQDEKIARARREVESLDREQVLARNEKIETILDLEDHRARGLGLARGRGDAIEAEIVWSVRASDLDAVQPGDEAVVEEHVEDELLGGAERRGGDVEAD